MGKRSRLLGAIGLLAAVAAIVFLYFQRDASLVQRLNDGSYLRIASVDYGPKHSYALPKLKPWQQTVAKYLPESLAMRLGWRGGDGSVGSGARPGENTLGVTAICETAGQYSFYSPQLELLDEAGNRYGLTRPGAVSSSMPGKGGRRLMMWQFYSIPPEGKPLVLRFIYNSPGAAAAGKTNQESVVFHVPNPVKPPAH